MKKDEKGTQDQAMDISALSSGEEGVNRGDWKIAVSDVGEKLVEHGFLGAKRRELSVSYTYFWESKSDEYEVTVRFGNMNIKRSFDEMVWAKDRLEWA